MVWLRYLATAVLICSVLPTIGKGSISLSSKRFITYYYLCGSTIYNFLLIVGYFTTVASNYSSSTSRCRLGIESSLEPKNYTPSFAISFALFSAFLRYSFEIYLLVLLSIRYFLKSILSVELTELDWYYYYCDYYLSIFDCAWFSQSISSVLIDCSRCLS